MLYLDDCEINSLYSIIESIYLGEKSSDRLSNSGILVNPDRVNYISGKTVVINHLPYSMELCDILHSNGCSIISRIQLSESRDYIKFQPYYIKPEFRIAWNGMTLDVKDLDFPEIMESLEDSVILILSEQPEIYFPKLLNLRQDLVYDDSSNLTALGWLMHQVGLNTDKGSKFQDMDLLKTKKMLF